MPAPNGPTCTPTPCAFAVVSVAAPAIASADTARRIRFITASFLHVRRQRPSAKDGSGLLQEFKVPGTLRNSGRVSHSPRRPLFLGPRPADWFTTPPLRSIATIFHIKPHFDSSPPRLGDQHPSFAKIHLQLGGNFIHRDAALLRSQQRDHSFDFFDFRFGVLAWHLCLASFTRGEYKGGRTANASVAPRTALGGPFFLAASASHS